MNTPTDTSTLQVFFVDDDIDEAYLFAEAVEHAGIQINLVLAQNGKHLAQLLHEQTPQLIVLDINMPHKDGFETLAYLRQNEAWQRIPVVIYSTSKQKRDIDRSYQYGANGYVIKPADFDELVATVKKMCSLDWYTPYTTEPHQFLIK